MGTLTGAPGRPRRRADARHHVHHVREQRFGRRRLRPGRRHIATASGRWYWITPGRPAGEPVAGPSVAPPSAARSGSGVRGWPRPPGARTSSPFGHSTGRRPGSAASGEGPSGPFGESFLRRMPVRASLSVVDGPARRSGGRDLPRRRRRHRRRVYGPAGARRTRCSGPAPPTSSRRRPGTLRPLKQHAHAHPRRHHPSAHPRRLTPDV